MTSLTVSIILIIGGLVIGGIIVYSLMNSYFAWRMRIAREMMPHNYYRPHGPPIVQTPSNEGGEVKKQSNKKISVWILMVLLLSALFGYLAWEKYAIEEQPTGTDPPLESPILLEEEPETQLSYEVIPKDSLASIVIDTSDIPISEEEQPVFFSLQIGSFQSFENAKQEAIVWSEKYRHSVYIGKDEVGLYKVLVEDFLTKEDAKSFKATHRYLNGAFIRHIDDLMDITIV